MGIWLGSYFKYWSNYEEITSKEQNREELHRAAMAIWRGQRTLSAVSEVRHSDAAPGEAGKACGPAPVSWADRCSESPSQVLELWLNVASVRRRWSRSWRLRPPSPRLQHRLLCCVVFPTSPSNMCLFILCVSLYFHCNPRKAKDYLCLLR